MIKQEDLTIIIPHLDGTIEREYSLKQCLKSLEETFSGRIIVAYNNFEGWDGPVDPDTIYLSMQGQCHAVNAAAAICKTPWIMISNNDMVYPPGWFEKIAQTIDSFEPLCISPKLVEPRPGAPTFLHYFCGGAGGDFNKQKFLDFVKEREQNSVSIHDGFNTPFLIKKELWDLIGGYDIDYDPWGSNSDSDLEYKIRLAGVQPIQAQDVYVYHFSQVSGTFHPDNRPFWEKNWHYFIDKWGFERASSPEIWEANFEIPEDKLKFHPFWKGFYAETI